MKKLPIGTKVFDIHFGWGDVINISDTSEYPVAVKFEGSMQVYTQEGLYRTTDKFRTLSLTEYTLETGGFTPISEYRKPKVGDWGYFWSYKSQPPGYGLLTGFASADRHPYIYVCNNNEIYQHFSHKIPQEYIDYLNTLK
jgi:hypothetical protein